MSDSKKSINALQLAFICALSEGFTILPGMILSGLLTEKQHNVSFFVPVIVVYTVQRACLVALRGIGDITNPHKIMKGGLMLALPGALLMAASAFFPPLLMAGVLLVGIGITPVKAMLVPIYAKLIEQDKSLKKSKGIGTAIYLVIVILAMALKKLSFPVVPIIFLVFLALVYSSLLKIDGDGMFNGAKAFDVSKRMPVYYIHSVLVLLCLLVLRQYKQSGVSVLIWIAPAAMIISTLVEIKRHPNYHDFVYRTYWAGGLSTFLLVYSLLYHSSVGHSKMSTPVYLAIAVGGVLTSFVKKPLKKAFPENKYVNISMLLAASFAFLLASPVPAVNIAGIVAATAFNGIVSSSAKAGYLQDERHSVLERPLAQLRIYTVGGVLNQVIIFFTIYILGEVIGGESLLSGYAAGAPDPAVGAAMLKAGLICSVVWLAAAFAIVLFAGKEQKPTEEAITGDPEEQL